MLARDLAQAFPTVTLTDALDAARLLAEHRLPGLIVLDGTGRPYTVRPGSQVLCFIVSTYVQDAPALARVYDEKSADELCAKLVTRQVSDALPKRRDVLDLPIVARTPPPSEQARTWWSPASRLATATDLVLARHEARPHRDLRDDRDHLDLLLAPLLRRRLTQVARVSASLRRSAALLSSNHRGSRVDVSWLQRL